MNKIYAIFFVFCCFSICSCHKQSNIKEIYQDRTNIVSVWNLVKPITSDSMPPLNPGWTKMVIVNKYLLVIDYKTKDKFIHILDVDGFKYIKSILSKGHSKDEIVQISGTFPDEQNHCFFTQELGRKILRINMDSIIADENYIPNCIWDWGKNPSVFTCDCNITKYPIAIANTMEPTGNSGYNQSIVRLNLETGDINKFDYTHPYATKKRIDIAASSQFNTCVALYHNRDLITLYDLEGNVKANIYGPDWNETDRANGLYYWDNAIFVNDKIYALYSGSDYYKDSYSKKIIVLDKDGEYLSTLDMDGHRLGSSICYDSHNNRLIFTTDEYELSYLSLNDLCLTR